MVCLVNENHARACSSPEWAEMIQNELLPSLTRGVELGDEMLEVGPGPGAATEWLRQRVTRLVALEIDQGAAQLLSERLNGTNVVVAVGDATAMDFPDGSFDSVGCFTMLHHVPTLQAQFKVLSEIFRVLRPGGVLIASDGIANSESHDFHAGDTYNPIDPSCLLSLIRALGFAQITLGVDRRLHLVAHKPMPESTARPEAFSGLVSSWTTTANKRRPS